LVMWKNVGRAAFWFGSGSMIFCSSSFSTDIEFRHVQLLMYFISTLFSLLHIEKNRLVLSIHLYIKLQLQMGSSVQFHVTHQKFRRIPLAARSCALRA
jgi:hypothetical protein